MRSDRELRRIGVGSQAYAKLREDERLRCQMLHDKSWPSEPPISIYSDLRRRRAELGQEYTEYDAMYEQGLLPADHYG